MILLKKPIKLLCSLSVGVLLSCSSNQTPSKPSNYTLPCETFLSANSAAWREDSLGAKGKREIIIDSLVKICEFKGELWSKISNHFGTPFSRAIYDDSLISYKFRINYFKEGEHSNLGNLFLMVEVINDTITLFRILEIDG